MKSIVKVIWFDSLYNFKRFGVSENVGRFRCTVNTNSRFSIIGLNTINMTNTTTAKWTTTVCVFFCICLCVFRRMAWLPTVWRRSWRWPHTGGGSGPSGQPALVPVEGGWWHRRDTASNRGQSICTHAQSKSWCIDKKTMWLSTMDGTDSVNKSSANETKTSSAYMKQTSRVTAMTMWWDLCVVSQTATCHTLNTQYTI